MSTGLSPALGTILDGLMARYRANVPEVGAITAAMVAEGLIAGESSVENDHIAFRTIGVPHLGIGSLEKVFLHHGYQARDWFDFPVKKLDARWYAPPVPEAPRVFISQLRVAELSESARQIIGAYTGQIARDPVDAIDLDDPADVVAFLHRPLWPTPTWSDHVALAIESEYAAWVIYNRYYLNHYTITVHNLPDGYCTIEAFNRFLERRGFRLNDSGGTVKTSPDGKLRQSATVAAMVEARFSDGRGGEETHRIAGSYVEFAERRVLDQFAHLPSDQIQREHRREGFETGNADRIFESTYEAQTRRRTS